MPHDPRELLRAWVPHLALLGLALAAGWWLLLVIAPVGDALMLAAALAVLTYPVLFLPIDHALASLFGNWQVDTRRYLSALAATAVLGALMVGFALMLLVAVVGDLAGTVRLVIGLAVQDPVRINEVIDLLMTHVATVSSLMPSLHLDQEMIRLSIREVLSQVSVGSAFMQYLVTGTGGFLAQSALTLVTLFYLYSQGPRLVTMLMSCLPLTFAQRLTIEGRFQSTAVHLITGTAARAAFHGIAIGLIAWPLSGLNPILVAVFAAFVALLPVAGPMVAWLPIASVLWTKGEIPSAIGLGVGALAAAWLIEHLASRIASHLGTDDMWLSFLLFLGLVGGVLGFGPRGLILGPAAVLTFSILIQVLPALYGRQELTKDP
ncbi:MAG: AI-2E family transporter [Planctomycetes bacterium]|nr:AI-2E family transporter [Planctomycetota bacterium]